MKNKSTLDALEKVRNFTETAKLKQVYAILLTIDVRNAFNSIVWKNVHREFRDRGLPLSIKNIIKSYFSNRWIHYLSTEKWVKRKMFRGVPQGSILGPTIWNLIYDGVLRLNVPKGSQLVGYADDLAVLVMDKDLSSIKEKITVIFQDIEQWMEQNRLDIAKQKTKYIFLTQKKVNKHFNIILDGHKIKPEAGIKYLGVFFENNTKFSVHTENVTQKALKMSGALTRLTNNIGGSVQKNRVLYYNIIESIVTYASPIWKDAIHLEKNLKRLRAVQRVSMARVVRVM